MYPSHQWPPQGPVYDYPSPAPTGRANKSALIVGIVLVVILGWAVFLGVVFSSSGPSPTHTASTPRVNPEDDTFLQKLDRMLGTPWSPHPASADRAQWVGIGHQVCAKVSDGWTFVEIERMVQQETGYGPPANTGDMVIVGVSIDTYCPWASGHVPGGGDRYDH